MAQHKNYPMQDHQCCEWLLRVLVQTKVGLTSVLMLEAGFSGLAGTKSNSLGANKRMTVEIKKNKQHQKSLNLKERFCQEDECKN